MIYVNGCDGEMKRLGRCQKKNWWEKKWMKPKSKKH